MVVFTARQCDSGTPLQVYTLDKPSQVHRLFLAYQVDTVDTGHGTIMVVFTVRQWNPSTGVHS